MSQTSRERLPHREKIQPDHVGVLVAAFVIALVGWGGLYWLVVYTIPRVGQRWLFFMLLQMAVTGTVIPLVRYLNLRFTPIDRDPPMGNVIVRQATWIALFTVTCAWLQIPRVLSWSVAFFLAIVFVVIEIFVRSRERQLESLLDE